MLKLMKYEFRKTIFSKLILFAVTAFAEAVFLFGLFLKKDNMLAVGLMLLFLCAVFGILYIGIDSLLVFHKDLNTKQSYMLFLTPKNSYQILGAKVLENGLSIFFTGAFFVILAAVDVTVSILYLEGLQEFLKILDEMNVVLSLNVELDPQQMISVFFMMLSSWLATVVTGYFAIVLSATVLSGKRFSGFISFVLFILINICCSSLINLIPVQDISDMAYVWLMIIAELVIAAVIYAISGWVMERKLSV